MSAVSKSKNSIPNDKQILSLKPDPQIASLQNFKVEIIRNKPMESSASMKKLDIPVKQISGSKSELSISKHRLELTRKTPPKNTEPRFGTYDRSATPETPFANCPSSPKTQICNKPILQISEVQQLKNENTQKQQMISEYNCKVDQMTMQINNLTQQVGDWKELAKKLEKENLNLKEQNERTFEENQQMYVQMEDLIKTLEFSKEELDRKSDDQESLKITNNKLSEELRQYKNEKLKLGNPDLQKELNQKCKDIQQLQEVLLETNKKLSNLRIDYDQQQQEQYKQQQSCRSEQDNHIYCQAQIEQIKKEKQICEDKLVEYQSKINSLQEQKPNQSQSISNSSYTILNNNQHNNTTNGNSRELTKLKKVLEIQRKQIESQQKTIMNQHFEIQSMQTLLYNSNDSIQKQSYCSNDMDMESSGHWHHIKDKENQYQARGMLDIDIPNLKQSFQKPTMKFVQEDTFRNLDKQNDSE